MIDSRNLSMVVTGLARRLFPSLCKAYDVKVTDSAAQWLGVKRDYLFVPCPSSAGHTIHDGSAATQDLKYD